MHQKVTLVFFEIVFIFIILNSILEKNATQFCFLFFLDLLSFISIVEIPSIFLIQVYVPFTRQIKKNLLIQIYLEFNYWFIYIKVIPNCCESSSVFTIPLNNGQMYAKLEKTSDFQSVLHLYSVFFYKYVLKYTLYHHKKLKE